MSSKT